MSKVLIFTETIGGNGHYCAARSIQKALAQMDQTIDIKLVNGLSLVSRKLEDTIRQAYLHTLRYAPKLWGKAYSKEGKLSVLFQTPLGQLLAHYLQELITEEKPDVVVCTHAFCLSAVAELKSKHDFQLGAAITDFDAHGFWLHDEVDFYLVAHDCLRDKIVKTGYRNAEIVTTGIPIDPLFNEIGQIPKLTLRKKCGIDEGKPTLLLMGGGMGLGPMDHIIGELVEEFGDTLQIVVVTGRNQLLREKCEADYSEQSFVRILGYVEDLANYMAASDLIVTKPGGLTSSEALALGLPILITEPIPGQEERNTRFLLAQRVALRVNRSRDVSRYVRPFIEDPLFYEQFTDRARNTGRPASARHAAEVILQRSKKQMLMKKS